MTRTERTLAYPLFHPESELPPPLTLSATDFRREFPSEGQHIEFKEGIVGKQIQDSVVAFSNADGGVLLVGVDNSGRVTGHALDATTQDHIHQALQAARDVGRYALSEVDVGGSPVSIISVGRRRDGFAQTSSGVVRVRRGSRDDPLFGAELVRFANERTPSRFETTPLSADREAINPVLLAELVEVMGWDVPTDDLLRDQELLVDGRLTVAGALYLLDDPARELGKAWIEIRRFDDDVSIDHQSRVELRGPLHRVLSEAVSEISDQLGAELVVIGTRRYELPKLPEVVLREALANAVAHRSYEATGTPIRVELRPSVVVVRSPGGLPEPVTVENIRDASAARNLAVIRILRRHGLAEDQGRGVDVMQDTMRDQMLDPPRFADSGHEVRVELSIRSTIAPVERAWIRELEARGTLLGLDRLVLIHAARGIELTNAQVRGILGVDAHEARLTLQRLRDAGFVEQRGSRGGATYRLAGGLRPPAGLRLSADELSDVVIELAAAGSITNADVRQATGLDRAESLALLRRLVAGGLLRRTGERRGSRYEAV